MHSEKYCTLQIVRSKYPTSTSKRNVGVAADARAIKAHASALALFAGGRQRACGISPNNYVFLTFSR